MCKLFYSSLLNRRWSCYLLCSCIECIHEIPNGARAQRAEDLACFVHVTQDIASQCVSCQLLWAESCHSVNLWNQVFKLLALPYGSKYLLAVKCCQAGFGPCIGLCLAELLTMLKSPFMLIRSVYVAKELKEPRFVCSQPKLPLVFSTHGPPFKQSIIQGWYNQQFSPLVLLWE